MVIEPATVHLPAAEVVARLPTTVRTTLGVLRIDRAQQRPGTFGSGARRFSAEWTGRDVVAEAHVEVVALARHSDLTQVEVALHRPQGLRRRLAWRAKAAAAARAQVLALCEQIERPRPPDPAADRPPRPVATQWSPAGFVDLEPQT